MAKYVDIESVVKRLTSVCVTDDTFGMGIQMGINRAMEIIGEARIVDAVEVVRCKDCWKWFPYNGGGSHDCPFCGYPEENDYCFCGERRTE